VRSSAGKICPVRLSVPYRHGPGQHAAPLARRQRPRPCPGRAARAHAQAPDAL